MCCQTFFLFLFSFPCSADYEQDWPPCKVVLSVGNQYADFVCFVSISLMADGPQRARLPIPLTATLPCHPVNACGHEG